jgi:GTP diphosphokinase / guanosine-3',5'-bis(diphosphate) 3'-diphosphatase
MNPAQLLKALQFASVKHRMQRRKDAASSPYINHPIAVATVLAVEGEVADEPVLVAAILHDTLEDTETTPDELLREFGDIVTSLVREVTDDRTLPRAERKRMQIVHASVASAGAKLIKIADKICNVRDIGIAPPVLWTRKRREEYLQWSTEVVNACRDVNPKLDRAFDDAVVAARAKIGK